jgi:large subunit ribosomal protein L1
VAALKKFKGPKFDMTVNVALHLNIDPAQADQGIRGSVSLPAGIGAKKRVVAFCREDLTKACLDAGAIKAGADELVAEIEKGWMDFDVAVATPDMMRVVSKLGKVLGPKGLMPSPKTGAVTPKLVADVPVLWARVAPSGSPAFSRFAPVFVSVIRPSSSLLEAGDSS